MRLKTMSQAILLLGLIVAPCLAIAAEPTFKEGWFTTNDGVKLHYLEAGSGNPLVMIPGWSQSAMEFKYQLTGLSDKYHVYALDMRGHGESAKPNHGYRIQRLSADVHDFLAGEQSRRGDIGRPLHGVLRNMGLLGTVRQRSPVEAHSSRSDADDHEQPRVVTARAGGRWRNF